MRTSFTDGQFQCVACGIVLDSELDEDGTWTVMDCRVVDGIYVIYNGPTVYRLSLESKTTS